jgi:hypothetical protein
VVEATVTQAERPLAAIMSCALASLGLVAWAIVLTNLSITGSSDSPCESILWEHAVWSRVSSCGIAHLGTLGIVLGLGATGLAVALIAALAAAGKTSPKWAILFTSVATVAGVLVTLALVLRVATYDEPVLRRGWAAVRNASALATAFLAVITAAIALAPSSTGR